MANEARITNTYSFSRSGLTLSATNTENYSITGTNAVGTVQNIASGTVEAITIGDCADLRYVFIKNQTSGTTAYLSTNAAMTQNFAILYPTGSILLSPFTTGIYASGIAGAIELQIVGNEG